MQFMAVGSVVETDTCPGGQRENGTSSRNAVCSWSSRSIAATVGMILLSSGWQAGRSAPSFSRIQITADLRRGGFSALFVFLPCPLMVAVDNHVQPWMTIAVSVVFSKSDNTLSRKDIGDPPFKLACLSIQGRTASGLKRPARREIDSM